jgi:hypothetical protein
MESTKFDARGYFTIYFSEPVETAEYSIDAEMP